MLVIKRHFIQPSMYMYAAIAAATFVITFGILAVIKPQFGGDQSRAGSGQVAKESPDKSSDPATMRKVAFSTDTSTTATPLQSTAYVSLPRQATDSNPQPSTTQPSTASSSSVETTNVTTTSASSSSQPADPVEPAPSSTPAATPAPAQNPSLLGGLVQGLGGLLNALL